MAGTANHANPTKTVARWGFEQTPCLGDVANWQDARILSESLGAELPTIQDESLNPSGEQEEGDPSKIDVGGDVNLNFHVDDTSKALASYFAGGATPVQSPTGVYTHKLAPTETDIAFDTMALEISRGERRPYLYPGAICNRVVMNAQPRGYLTGALGFAIPRFEVFDGDTDVVGTPGPVYLRGLPQYSFLQESVAAERRVYVEVQSVGAGTQDIRVKIGDAASYNTTDITVADDTWVRLTDENDAEVGTFDLPVEIYVPASTSLSATDEFYFQLPRPIWTPTLAARSVLNEISLEILVDDVVERIKTFGVTLTRPVEADENIGGRFNDLTIEQGQRTAVYQLSRRAFSDESFVNRLLRAESASIKMNAKSTLIGATGVRREVRLISMNCVPEGRTGSVSGSAQFDDAITMRAHPSQDVTYPSAVTCEIVTDTAVLDN